MAIFIYVLRCPVTGRPRYVGKTRNLTRRLKAHLYRGSRWHTNHSHCGNWIRTLLTLGTEPTMSVVSELPEGGDWQAEEMRVIRWLRELGHDLTNMTAGGDGFHDVHPDVLKRVGAAVRKRIAANKEKFLADMAAGKATPQAKANRRRGVERAWADPVIRARFIEGMNELEALERRATASRKRLADPVALAAHAARMTAIWNTPERRIEATERVKAAWADPEITARRLASLAATWAKPETKQRHAEAMDKVRVRPGYSATLTAGQTAAWARPEVRKAHADGVNSPRMSASAKAKWADPVKANRLLEAQSTPEHRALRKQRANERVTPEYRESQRAAAMAAWARRKAKEAAWVAEQKAHLLAEHGWTATELQSEVAMHVALQTTEGRVQ